MSLTRTNHGASVPMPIPNHWTRVENPCPKCGAAALRYYELNSDYGDERWECAKVLGGCGRTWVAEGADS